MTGHISNIKQYLGFGDRLIIDGVATEIKGGNYTVIKMKVIQILWRNRQHSHLYLPTGLLIHLKNLYTLFKLLIYFFQVFSVKIVLRNQPGSVQAVFHGDHQHFHIIKWLEQVIADA